MEKENRDYWSSILGQRGFEKIGDVHYREHVQLWWHSADKLEVLLYDAGTAVLLKAVKTYYMRAIGPEGETYVRDLNNLQDYLQSHLPEIHITFSHYRDITADLAFRRMEEKRLAHDTGQSQQCLADHEAELGSLRDEFASKRQTLYETGELLKLDTGGPSLVQSYLQKRATELRHELEGIRRRGEGLERDTAITKNLLNEYLKKGAAACFTISFSSNLQNATSPEEFRDALEQIIKEVVDLHRFQVMQKLNGGKLRIYVEEAESPAVSWQIEWAGGALNPRQLERLSPESGDLINRTNQFLMVAPSQDVKLAGVVKDEQKLLGAWVVQSFLKRLDKLPRTGDPHRTAIPEGNMPIWVGRLMEGDTVTSEPAVFPLEMLESIYISGSTGSGKTFLVRVLTEGAVAYKEINILVLDPRNQSVGLLLAEDREEILEHYPEFGLDQARARGFRFRYYGPGIGAGEPLPTDLAELGAGRSIVSFKGMQDSERCETFAEILERVFDDHSREESEHLKTVLAIEEAQLFTKKRVADDAKSAAERAERAIETVLREGRKYGLRVFLVSQTIKDFAYGSASIRQNTNTKVFLKNSDREIDYASDFIEDGHQIIHLKTGTAVCYNAQWGSTKFWVRPPFSKVWELSAQDTSLLVSRHSEDKATSGLSPDAQRLFEIAVRYRNEAGEPVNVSKAAEKLGITSKRRMLKLIEEVERAGLVRTIRLDETGRPRVIVPTIRPDTD